jgi:hypothetical protein
MSAKVDVLAVIKEAARSAGDEAFQDGRDLIKALAAVAELIKALQMSDQWIREAKNQGCMLSNENTLRMNYAALDNIGPSA